MILYNMKNNAPISWGGGGSTKAKQTKTGNKKPDSCHKIHLFKLIEVIVFLLHVQTLQLCDEVVYVSSIIKEAWKQHMAERLSKDLCTCTVCNKNHFCIHSWICSLSWLWLRAGICAQSVNSMLKFRLSSQAIKMFWWDTRVITPSKR